MTVLGLVLVLLAAQTPAKASRAADESCGVSGARAGLRRLPRRRLSRRRRAPARRRRQGPAQRETGRCSCSPRASSTTATTRARGHGSSRWRGGGTARPAQRRRSAPPTACGWKGDRTKRPPQPTSGWTRRLGAHRRRRAGAVPHRRGGRRTGRGGGATDVPGIARDFPAHPLADEAIRRRAAAPARRRHRRHAGRARAAARADLSPADRLRRAESLSKDRHWDEALAELAKLPADAAARAGRRARLPDRDDEVPHAARLPDGRRSCCSAPSTRLLGRQGRVGAVPRRARAVARRPRRRGDRRLPQGHRAVPELALGGRGAVPVRAGSTTTAARSRRACRRSRRRWTGSARARSPTTPPGAWRSRISCSATPPRRRPASTATAACPRPASRSDEIGARVAYWRARLEAQARQERRRRGRLPRPGAARAALVLRPAGARAPQARPGSPSRSQMPAKKVDARGAAQPAARSRRSRARPS